REHVGAAREIFLDDVVLGRPLQRGALGALLVRHRDVEREQPRGGRVDGHRGVHAGKRDAVEQRPHVAEMRDRHADLADLAFRQQMIGVVAGLGRQIEGDREARLTFREVLPVERVRLARGRMTRVRAEDPRFIGHSASFVCRPPRHIMPRISLITTNRMIAPIKASIISRTIPVPSAIPKYGNSHAAMKAPMTPTTMSPIRPSPVPLTIFDAPQPATRPMTNVMIIPRPSNGMSLSLPLRLRPGRQPLFSRCSAMTIPPLPGTVSRLRCL